MSCQMGSPSAQHRQRRRFLGYGIIAFFAVVLAIAYPRFLSPRQVASNTSIAANHPVAAETPHENQSPSAPASHAQSNNSEPPVATPGTTGPDSEAAKAEEHIDSWVLRRAHFDVPASIADGTPYRFNPFPNVDYEVRPINKYSLGADSKSVSGPILDANGKEIGSATVATSTSKDGIGYAGNFRFDDGRVFTLRHNAKGEVVVDELDEPRMPGEAGHPEAPGAPAHDHHDLEHNSANNPHHAHNHAAHGKQGEDSDDHHAHSHTGHHSAITDEAPGEQPPPAADADTTGGTTVAADGTALLDGETEVTIAVAFSVAAQTAWGGDAAIRAQIALGISLANDAYRNSGIAMQLRLVYAGQVANGPGDFTDDLYKLTNNNDGIMDEVHTWRNTYGADVVSLVNNKTEYCGIGWLGPGESYMFTVTYVGCISNYTMAHELGHNFGCQHDRDNAGSGRYSYGYGYRFYYNGTQYRTIMAYAPGARTNYFSSPTHFFHGVAVGTANEDNARVMGLGISTVAAYRTSYYSISGRVTSGGSGVAGVTINGGSLGNATTDSSGNYTFSRVSVGTSYTITPSYTGTTFSPANGTGTLSGNVTLNFTLLRPPTLATINGQAISKSATSGSVTFTATDPQGGSPTVTATIARVDAVLYALDQTHDLATNAGSFSLNALGLSDKWVRGQSSAHQWFYILPSGALYQWGTSAANSTLVAMLPTSFYADPTLMYNRSAPSSSAKPSISVSGGAVQISNSSLIQGDFNITVTATTTGGTARQLFLFQVKNLPPVLANISNVSISKNTASTNVSLSATDPDGDSISYSASVNVSNDAALYTLDQQHNLAVYNNSYSLNSSGLGEKWIRGQAGARTWFYILPSGALYQYTTSIAASTLVATLPTVYFTDPTLLFDRNPAQLSNAPTVSVSGSTLTVTTHGYVGPIPITATASDGSLSNSKIFAVTSQNTAPTLTAVSDISVARGTSSRNVSLTATDPENDTLTYSASVDVSSDTALYTLDQANDLAANGGVITYNSVALQEKWIRGQIGARTWFYILPNGKIYRWGGSVAASTLETTVPTPYYRDPRLLFDRRPAQLSNAPTLSVSGSTLTIQPHGYVGTFVVTANASDGSLADSKNFAVIIPNTAPSFTAPGNQMASTNADPSPLTVTPSDAENDSLTLSATVDVSYDATLYTLDQANDLAANGGVITYNSLGLQEKWIRGQVGARTWFYILPDGRFYRWGGSVGSSVLAATVPSAFYTDPTLLFNRSAAQTGHTPTASWTSGSVAIHPNGYLGLFVVRLSASDGEFTTTKTFNVTSVSADRDGDGISDADEETGGSDPNDSGSTVHYLKGPVDVIWESHDGIRPTLQLLNPNANDETVTLRLSISNLPGSTASTVTVPAFGELQVPLANLNGYAEDSDGILHLDFPDALAGRVVYERLHAGKLEASFALPFASPLLKRTAVLWNMEQPSRKSNESLDTVVNRLVIANLESATASFFVYSRLEDGSTISEAELAVPAHSVLTTDAAQLGLIANAHGSLTLRAKDSAAKYLAHLVRAGLATDGQAYRFAYAIPARPGSGRALQTSVSDRWGAEDVLELVNTRDIPVHVQVQITDTNGITSGDTLTLAPYSVTNVDTSSYLSDLNVGAAATLISDEASSLIAYHTSYFRDADDGSIRAINSAVAGEALDKISVHAFDLRYGLGNHLMLSNTSEDPLHGRIAVHGTTQDLVQTFAMNAGETLQINLSDHDVWNLPANEHGVVVINLEDGSGLRAELVKVKVSHGEVAFVDNGSGCATGLTASAAESVSPPPAAKKPTSKKVTKKKTKTKKAKPKKKAKAKSKAKSSK